MATFLALHWVIIDIHLSDNIGLKGNSFAYNAFPIVNRNTTLSLYYITNLKYLREDVFYVFLENRQYGQNIIDLKDSPLGYYKENEWLFEYMIKLNLTDKILHAKTTDGKDLWQAEANMFTSTPDPTIY